MQYTSPFFGLGAYLKADHIQRRNKKSNPEMFSHKREQVFPNNKILICTSKLPEADFL